MYFYEEVCYGENELIKLHTRILIQNVEEKFDGFLMISIRFIILSIRRFISTFFEDPLLITARERERERDEDKKKREIGCGKNTKVSRYYN